LAAIIGLLGTANANQQSAIGSGLGQASQILVSTNPALANLIQMALATEVPGPVTAAYSAATGNTEIGETGGGGGSGAGPVTGGPPIGGAGATGFGTPSTFAPTIPSLLLGGAVVSNGFGNNGNNGNNTTTTIVISGSNTAK
jgi:hypothetical protein